MNTNRFETFYDAILAIIITVLVLKIPQPLNPTWGSFFQNSLHFTTYLIVFLTIINIWYSNQKLFQYIDKINNKVLFVYGNKLFLITLIPYFASWLSMNLYSLTAETIFGILIIFANISHIISAIVVFGANKSNEKLKELNVKKIHYIGPLTLTAIGFIISYTVYVPGIYITSLFAVILSIFYNRKYGKEIENTERFEALIDAIIAIIITIIVLEIPTALNGNLESLIEIKFDFIAYIISFIVCFNSWKITYNIFSIINKINFKAIWSISLGLFFLSFIPYLSTFVAMHFNEFVPQCIYGINFIIINICYLISTYEIKKIDEDNLLLQIAFENYNKFIITIISTCVFIAIGYFYYPPIIIISCIFSIIASWIFVIAKINIINCNYD